MSNITIKIQRRGITPIIAIILLLMMTVAAAGASFYWLIKIQGELQGGTSQFQEQTFDRISSGVNWEGADYNKTIDQLTISLLNTGTTKIPIDNMQTSPKVQWNLLDSNQDVVCSTDWSGINLTTTSGAVGCLSGCGTSLEPSELRLIKLDISNSTECNISGFPEDSTFFVKISFSGKATSSGNFNK